MDMYNTISIKNKVLQQKKCRKLSIAKIDKKIYAIKPFKPLVLNSSEKFGFHWKSGPAPKRTESLETADSEIIATSRTIPMIAINVSIIELQVVHDCKGNIH
jgi:hypothetical protein